MPGRGRAGGKEQRWVGCELGARAQQTDRDRERERRRRREGGVGGGGQEERQRRRINGREAIDPELRIGQVFNKFERSPFFRKTATLASDRATGTISERRKNRNSLGGIGTGGFSLTYRAIISRAAVGATRRPSARAKAANEEREGPNDARWGERGCERERQRGRMEGTERKIAERAETMALS